MRKNKILLTVVVMLQLLLFHCSANAAYPIGDIYTTDTTACIDGYNIPVYVYNNYPYVVAEDLERYGFDIRWNAYEKVLDINYNAYKSFNAYAFTDINFSAVDRYEGSVYNDENRVRLNGQFVTAYSLSGRMLISLDELWRIGEVNWYSESKTIGVVSTKCKNDNPYISDYLKDTYIADKVAYYFIASVDTRDAMGDYYNTNYLGKPDTQTVYIDRAYRDYFVVTKNKLNECLNYISNTPGLYKRDILYNMTYTAITLQDEFIRIYDNMDRKSASYTDSSVSWINEAGKSEGDAILNYYNSFYN